MKRTWILILIMSALILTGCGGDSAQGNDTANNINSDISSMGDNSEVFNMVGRWEMVGNIEGISYIYEFYPDHTGVTFASPHSYREIMFYVEQNDIRIDYYQGGEINHTEIMEIVFDNEDQITLKAEGAIPITLLRVPLPETPAYVRARVALLLSNQAHTIVEAEQEDERTWYATVQVEGEEGTRLIKIYLDDSGVWMPSEVQP
jgi:hypothetical protein